MPAWPILTILLLTVPLIAHVRVAAQAGAGSSAPAKRVEPFKRLSEMRVKPPAGAPSGPNVRRATQACPATLDEMCEKFWDFAGYFLRKNTIPARDRELVTLRTAWLSRGEYIWASHHDTFATKEGVTREEVSRVMEGPDAKGWSRFDSALLRAVDELQTSRFISDGTWAALGERYTDRQRMEVVFTVAAYTSLAMYFNSTGAQLEAGRTGFPN
jgi:alkylhydroperoxidase family enzyme